MLQTQQDEARSDALFAVIENRLREHGSWQTAPTALLRLKGAIKDVADAEVCLAALESLRSALKLEVAARSNLTRRCRLLEAALRDLDVTLANTGPEEDVAGTFESAANVDPERFVDAAKTKTRLLDRGLSSRSTQAEVSRDE